jgi:superfamily I DNA and/or RNA helicase
VCGRSRPTSCEAVKVIELIQELVREQPEKDIGIVTFNVAQQDLILDLLENLEIAGTFNRPKSLIVKNIENIQGDEKDIIIFSTAYAPDSKGQADHAIRQS